MFLRCLCSSLPKPCAYSSKNKFYEFVKNRLAEQEMYLLQLIYHDLSSRNPDHQLVYDNFVIFFHLTGLWGAKLFREFDEDRAQFISLEQFLYGISRTVKAPLQQKIKLLFSFFEGKEREGIKYKNFIKMLYNYSREEIKDILIEDGFLPVDIPRKSRKKKIPVVELNYQESKHETQSSCFEQAYRSIIDFSQQGTFLEINKKDLTYKIHYSNMNTLIQQFAAKIYMSHQLEISHPKYHSLSFEKFSNWIKEHRKLYNSYYSAFRTQLWSYHERDPNYLNYMESDFTGKYQCGEWKGKVYVMLVGDALVVCQGKKQRKRPMKIICLSGLEVKEAEKFGIILEHHCESYPKSTFYFQKQNEREKWMERLKIYQGDSLYTKYLIGDVIGTGNFSIVYKCQEKKTGKTYALKMIQTQKLTKQARSSIRNESQIIKIINHPQIVKHKETIHSKNHEYIITEYIYGEDLYQYVKTRRRLNEFQSAFITGHIIKAVIHLHNLQIIHRDLKPENIMVLFKNKKEDEIFQCTTPTIRKGQRIQTIKIIDFGLSNHMSELGKGGTSQKVSGTPNYIAPEVLLGKNPTFKSDNFAIGAIIYFLLRGKLPFLSTNAEKTLIRTVKGDFDFEDQHWAKISSEAKDLIIKLLEVDPDKRIDLDEALNHQWFSAVFERTKQSSKSCTNSEKEQIQETDYPESIKLGQIQLNNFNHRFKSRRSRKLSISQEKRFSPALRAHDRYSK